MNEKGQINNNTLISESKLEELHPDMFRWALSCCNFNKEDAEDVLQLSYMKILDGSIQYNGGADLKAWLFAIIRYTAKAKSKRNAIRLRLLKKWFQNKKEQNIQNKSQEGRVIEKENSDNILMAIAKLPKRQKEILELVFYHDMTIQEASKIMRVTLGTARKHYERAKNKLSHKLMEN